MVVVDDHLLRDVLTGRRDRDLDGLGADGIATTGLWLFRLCSSYADPDVIGALSRPVAALGRDAQERFVAALVELPDDIVVVPMRDLAWSMARLQVRHRAKSRNLSAAMVEALATAHHLEAGIAVSRRDVGPNLRAAARADGIAFHSL